MAESKPGAQAAHSSIPVQKCRTASNQISRPRPFLMQNDVVLQHSFQTLMRKKGLKKVTVSSDGSLHSQRTETGSAEAFAGPALRISCPDSSPNIEMIKCT